MKMKKISALLLIVFSLTTGVVKADPHPIGDVQTKTADIVFSLPSKTDFNITPMNNLIAGPNKSNTKVATYVLTVNQPSYLAVRWTPNSGIINASSIKISGSSDPSHTISLKFKNQMSSISTQNGWMFTGAKYNKLNGDIIVAGDQTVPADTYTLSMDASVFAA